MKLRASCQDHQAGEIAQKCLSKDTTQNSVNRFLGPSYQYHIKRSQGNIKPGKMFSAIIDSKPGKLFNATHKNISKSVRRNVIHCIKSHSIHCIKPPY